MPKIKNWSKVDDNEWEHDKTGDEVFIGTAGTGYRPVYVDNYTERGRKKRRTRELGRSSFSTVENARDYARTWMKNHPNP